jgi:hypothetical protein
MGALLHRTDRSAVILSVMASTVAPIAELARDRVGYAQWMCAATPFLFNRFDHGHDGFV